MSHGVNISLRCFKKAIYSLMAFGAFWQIYALGTYIHLDIFWAILVSSCLFAVHWIEKCISLAELRILVLGNITCMSESLEPIKQMKLSGNTIFLVCAERDIDENMNGDLHFSQGNILHPAFRIPQEFLLELDVF